MIELDAVMNRKDSEIDSEPCIVAKIIELPTNNFFYFKNHLLEDQSFLMDNIDLMGFDEDNIRRCLLVLGEGYDEGILVDTQGCNYARYTAHIPNGRQLAELNQYQSLRDFTQQMRDVADEVVRKILDNQQDGYYYIRDKDIPISVDNPMFSYSLLGEMLSEREEFDTVETFTHEIGVTINPKYLMAHYDENNCRVLSQNDVDIMVAKHILFLRNAGDEQADFNGCLVRDCDLSHANLNNAILENSVFFNCKFNDAQMCFANGCSATFIKCDMQGMMCEEADFSHCKFQHCNMQNIIATHASFAWGSFDRCDVKGAVLQKACVEDTEWSNTDLSNTNTRDFSHSYDEWSTEGGIIVLNQE